MSRPFPVVQGWCPGALRPMQSGDGWVVRLRPYGGRLTAQQAQGVAQLSVQYGNGVIDISARANIQLRGVAMSGHIPLIEGLRALGLVDDSALAEAQRNVILSPFWAAGDGAHDLALALSAVLVAPTAPRLPGKFGFAIDLGPAPLLRDKSADIRIERHAGGALIYAQGARTGAVAPLGRAADVAIDLAQWFVQSGGIGADGRGRMAALLATGAPLPDAFTAHPVPFAQSTPPCIGIYPQGALVGFHFGQMQAATLLALAQLGPLRVTPWRMVLIEGLAEMPSLQALITTPGDPMLRVIACIGAPACLQAFTPTRDLAHSLAPHVPKGQLLHISGCAKGCAHPFAADLTLTATPHGFDLVQNGRAGDTPLRADLAPSQIPQALNAP